MLQKESLKEINGRGTYPDKFNFDSSAVICKKSKINGQVTIGANTIIHPAAIIRGIIKIGSNNIIEESCQIIGDGNKKIVIGNCNHFEVGAKISGNVGNCNVIQHRAVIGDNVKVGNGCSIGIRIELTKGETIEDNTGMYGNLSKRRKLHSGSAETNMKAIIPKIELLKSQIEKEQQREKKGKR